MKQNNSLSHVSGLFSFVNSPLKKGLLAGCLSIAVFSCNDPDVMPQEANGAVTTPSYPAFTTLPSASMEPIRLSKVDLMMGRSSTAVGTVQVVVRSTDGTIITSSPELAVELLPTTTSWVTFHFPVLFPGHGEVIPGATYRIEILRSHPPVSGNGQVYVGGIVSSSSDPYVHGTTDRGSNFDYTFRTYTSVFTIDHDVLDQQQLRYRSSLPVVPNNIGVSIRWQDFVAGAQ